MKVYQVHQKISIDPLYLKAAMLSVLLLIQEAIVAIVTLAEDNPTNNPNTNNPTIKQSHSMQCLP
jgi:hypothetical protein